VRHDSVRDGRPNWQILKKDMPERFVRLRGVSAFRDMPEHGSAFFLNRKVNKLFWFAMGGAEHLRPDANKHGVVRISWTEECDCKFFIRESGRGQRVHGNTAVSVGAVVATAAFDSQCGHTPRRPESKPLHLCQKRRQMSRDAEARGKRLVIGILHVHASRLPGGQPVVRCFWGGDPNAN